MTRSTWQGGSTYGSSYGSSYGASSGKPAGKTSYGGSSIATKSTNGGAGITYGGVGKLGKSVGQGKDMSAFRVGVKVKHPKFGEGTIISVRGAGNNMFLDIAFEGLGIKQLSAALAPLSIL